MELKLHFSSSEKEGNDEGVLRRGWAINLHTHGRKTETISLIIYTIRIST